jgi:hypothetical protein
MAKDLGEATLVVVVAVRLGIVNSSDVHDDVQRRHWRSQSARNPCD